MYLFDENRHKIIFMIFNTVKEFDIKSQILLILNANL